MTEGAVVVCLGNRMRGDDAAGPLVADALRSRGRDAIACEGEPIDVIDQIRDARRAVLIDAVAGAEPGRIWRFDASREDPPLAFAGRSSTHLLGLAEVLALARALGALPPRVDVIGIEGDRFGLGQDPSPAVEAAAAEVAATVLAEPRTSEPAGLAG